MQGVSMRTCLTVCAFVVLFAPTASSQADFDCAPVGLLPNDATANCEGVNSNNRSTLTAVSATLSCGFPTFGPNYLRIGANGGSGVTVVSVPAGGPLPRPLNPLISEVRIPIPAGATTVSFSWEFFNAE